MSEQLFEPGREAEFLQLLLENIDVGVSVLDEDLRYRLISRAVYNQLGIDPSDLPLGSSLSDCHDLMVENGLFSKEVIERNKLSEEEQRRRAAAGRTLDSSMVELGDGSVHRFFRKSLPGGQTISMATEVTELVEKDRLLDSALDLGGAGYWTYDLQTKQYELSRSLHHYFGPERVAEIHAKGIISVVHPDYRQAYIDGVDGLKRGKNSFEVEGQTNPASGKTRWSRTTAELVRDPNGRPLRIRAFVKDITRDRRMRAQLERAKDEAIAASHAKSEFLANMSHEIRTPMNGVLGMAELLAESGIDEQQREYVSVINSSANALLNIINDILDFSKIEAGALEIDPMPFSLKTSIDDVVALVGTSARDKGLELIVNYPAEALRHFIGDAGRIRQVLTNLLSNAIKFTEEGVVTVNVDVRPVRDMAVLSIEVSDTGIGIPPEKLASVFDKFIQADGSTTRVYGGTGLGLTISKRIVEMMDGRLGVTSDVGKGSTFRMRVPLPINPNAMDERFDIRTLQDKRVLVVDDIALNCRVMREQLGVWSMAVDCAHEGVDAIARLKAAQDAGKPYDLILLDYLMPGVNGRELASILTNQSEIVVPPIIMLSSCDQSVSSAKLAETGIQTYLVKPVRERRLYDSVVRVLSNSAPQHRSHAATDAAPPTVIRSPLAPTQNPDVVAAKPPQHAPQAPADTPPDPQPAAPSVPTTPAKTEILVAEDFPLNQDVVRLMLASSPFAPHFVENGQLAVDAFTAEPDRFALVLMDVSMPVMDGYDATRAIRSFEQSNGRTPVPIIALTGHALKDDRERCLAAGMSDFLTKPVKQLGLLEKLEAHSGRAVEAA